MKICLCRYEVDFYMNVVYGWGIIFWVVVDISRLDLYCDEFIGFVILCVIFFLVGEVSFLFGD